MTGANVSNQYIRFYSITSPYVVYSDITLTDNCGNIQQLPEGTTDLSNSAYWYFAIVDNNNIYHNNYKLVSTNDLKFLPDENESSITVKISLYTNPNIFLGLIDGSAQLINDEQLYISRNKTEFKIIYYSDTNNYQIVDNTDNKDLIHVLDPINNSNTTGNSRIDIIKNTVLDNYNLSNTVYKIKFNIPDITSDNYLNSSDPFDPFFFAKGAVVQIDSSGKQYVEVRMRLDLLAPERYINISNLTESFTKWYLVSVHEDSTYFTQNWGNYGTPNFKITYQGTGLGYSIVNISTGVNLAQLYNDTDASHPQLDLATITDSNFDIESVVVSGTEYYRIASRENTRDKYLTYANGWSSLLPSYADDPTGHGSLDPMYFDDILTGTSAKNQYIRFFSTTSPFNLHTKISFAHSEFESLTGKLLQYIDVRMIFTEKTPDRFICMTINASSDTPGNVIANVNKYSKWYGPPNDTDSRYDHFDWRIYYDSGNGYLIKNLDVGYYLHQILHTSLQTTTYPTHVNGKNKYFDIEEVKVDNKYLYRIKTKESTMSSTPYLSWTNIWGAFPDPTGFAGDEFDSVDPVIFKSLLTGTDASGQYIRFASITSPSYEIHQYFPTTDIDVTNNSDYWYLTLADPFEFVPNVKVQYENSYKFVIAKIIPFNYPNLFLGLNDVSHQFLTHEQSYISTNTTEFKIIYYSNTNNYQIVDNSDNKDLIHILDPSNYSTPSSSDNPKINIEKVLAKDSYNISNIVFKIKFDIPTDLTHNYYLDYLNNTFFFAKGARINIDDTGKLYVDVRMKFDLLAPERYIILSSNNILASVHDQSQYWGPTDIRYKQPDWRITYQGPGLGYDIVCMSHIDTVNASLARSYNTSGNHPYNSLSTIDNRYFDIEAVVDNSVEYYRILSKEHETNRILTYQDGWSAGDTDHPTGHESLDPCLFADVKTGTDAKEQYIRFYSITSPHTVFDSSSNIRKVPKTITNIDYGSYWYFASKDMNTNKFTHHKYSIS